MLHLRNTDFVPLPEPVRRFDTLTRLPRRRTFTAEEKARIVAESFVSGGSVCAVARRHGLMPSQLFAWRKNARGHLHMDLPAKIGVDQAEYEIAAFVAPEQCRDAPIEIAIGAVVVRVPQGVDPATLKMVLQAVREAA